MKHINSPNLYSSRAVTFPIPQLHPVMTTVLLSILGAAMHLPLERPILGEYFTWMIDNLTWKWAPQSLYTRRLNWPNYSKKLLLSAVCAAVLPLRDLLFDSPYFLVNGERYFLIPLFSGKRCHVSVVARADTGGSRDTLCKHWIVTK